MNLLRRFEETPLGAWMVRHRPALILLVVVLICLDVAASLMGWWL